jgi:hypothetical protein
LGEFVIMRREQIALLTRLLEDRPSTSDRRAPSAPVSRKPFRYVPTPA